MIINRFVVSLLLSSTTFIIVITAAVPLQSAKEFIKITSPLKNLLVLQDTIVLTLPE